MTTLHVSGVRFASVRSQGSSSAMSALQIRSPFLRGINGSSRCFRDNSWRISFQADMAASSRDYTARAINMTAGQLGEPEKLSLDHIVDKGKKLWDGCPQPVKSFPWIRAVENFIQLILDLVLSVVKYLSLPVFAVSSLSEMSYCAHERRLFLVPFPLLIGIVVAGVLRARSLELSPFLKEAEVPWHLIAIAIFFTLLKLPGPYYPYWGRILIPHFANGALLRTLWFAFSWYRKPRKASANMTKTN